MPPCNSDYMESNQEEKNSKKTCKRLQYALESLNLSVPLWVSKAANNYYGNPAKLNEAVVMLCKLCSEMTEDQKSKIIYNGKSKDARKLADWWDKHQEADRKREIEEANEKNRKTIKKNALAKLTKEEKEILLQGA